MDKLKMHTSDLAAEKFVELARLFPNAVTETIVGYEPVLDKDGKPVVGLDGVPKERPIIEHGVDPDILRQEINARVLSEKEERYQFTWPDKRKSMVLANAPINATLRPCRGESVNFDTTQNLYIEGDNLDVLKLLRDTYLGQVKIIYIDPPYNTGNNFIYCDDFADDSGDFLLRDYRYDEEPNRMVKNLDSSGRLHTNWLNMMYPRLRVARDFLADNGVIFISIDDNEAENLKKLCNEIFGESNFVACIIWERAYSPVNLKKHFSESHDYMLCYAKNIQELVCNGLRRSEEANDRYSNPDNDPRGNWTSADLSVGPAIECNIYEITTPSGRKVMPPSGYSWRLSKERFSEFLKDKRIWFGDEGNGVPRIKRFLAEVKQGITPMTIWKHSDVGHSQKASQDLKRLFDNNAVFTYPKPIELIKRILELYSTDDSIILDFFSGSATTAHAVMQLNAEDNIKAGKGNRRFIMVQIPETCDEKTEAYKVGYKNICEIGKERIRRAGRKIVDENPLTSSNLDIGFRVLKLDSSNMRDVGCRTPEENEQMSFEFDSFADNIKEDRTGEDLLFQVMLELGIPLSVKIRQDGKLWYADGSYLVACFDKVDTALVTEIAKKQPVYAVFRDSSFANGSAKVNFEQIFAAYSPNTIRKVQ